MSGETSLTEVSRLPTVSSQGRSASRLAPSSFSYLPILLILSQSSLTLFGMSPKSPMVIVGKPLGFLFIRALPGKLYLNHRYSARSLGWSLCSASQPGKCPGEKKEAQRGRTCYKGGCSKGGLGPGLLSPDPLFPCIIHGLRCFCQQVIQRIAKSPFPRGASCCCHPYLANRELSCLTALSCIVPWELFIAIKAVFLGT